MAQVLWFLLPAATVISHLVHAATSAGNTVAPLPPPLPAAPRPDCPDKCGKVDIPYPWGIGENCSWQAMYSLTCNHSVNPPIPYLGNVPVINISLESGEIRVGTPMSSLCYSSSLNWRSVNTTFNVTGSLLISPTRNEFTAIGCNTLALLKGLSYYSGCITSCVSLDAAAKNGDNCTGLGCCQTSIPSNLSNIAVDWDVSSRPNASNPVWNFSPCSYAFVAEKGWYSFEREDLNSTSFPTRLGDRTPLVLNWAINGSCPPTEKNGMLEELTAPACVSADSSCFNTSHGYLCNCSKGYRGNPYVTGGCTDINECEPPKSPCPRGSTCYNTPGDYKCKCNFGKRGDGRSDKGCQPIFPGYAIAIVATFVASILSCFAIMELKKRKQRRFFEKNGGQILKSVGINFFTERQLKKMTNHYRTPIGEGAFGKVFMGTTMDSAQRVAVKRSIAKGSALPQEEFVNEITFQFRVRHSNVVRLVGCCLETDVPMLVFEFVPNGSLHNVLHGAESRSRRPLPLPKRLDIAIGSAEALSYMHSNGGQTNHVHGDVKSGNILLDDDLTPKVSDFGSSKLVSIASKYAKWCVSGDMNYIDPMYIKTGRFTEKSDVYSFGVVLLELITRKTPKYNGENSLPLDFVKYFKEGRQRELYDRDILSDDDAPCLDSIGALAVRCLKEDSDERPTMAEVAKELKQVKVIAFGLEGHACPKAS